MWFNWTNPFPSSVEKVRDVTRNSFVFSVTLDYKNTTLKVDPCKHTPTSPYVNYSVTDKLESMVQGVIHPHISKYLFNKNQLDLPILN